MSGHYLIHYLMLHAHREFEELSAKGEKVGERAREHNIQQAASQNKSSDTSCMEDLEGDGEGEGEGTGKGAGTGTGADIAMVSSKSSDRNSGKEKDKESERNGKDKEGQGHKSDPNCV